jgi:sec-independent protein translocase protein TatB
MPSFGDTALIALLALLLFGPKKLPELARQLGKLMGEFRRASNEFRMQMEDELRVAEQEEQQKKIAAMQAAAPVTPVPQDESVAVEHSHVHVPLEEGSLGEVAGVQPQPLPIANSGELEMMPPATGLPVSRSDSAALSPMLQAIPHTAETDAEPAELHSQEASLHG